MAELEEPAVDIALRAREGASACAEGDERAKQVAKLTAELTALRSEAKPNLEAMRNAATARRAQGGTTISLVLTTITPVYGGGTQAGVVDPLVPFRPRAIKNGLRHWWWQLNRRRDEFRVLASDTQDAQKKAKKQALYDAMVDIWGGAAREGESLAARVHVEVTAVKHVRLAPYAAYKIVQPGGATHLKLTQDSKDPWLYALFGARGELVGDAAWTHEFTSPRLPADETDTFEQRHAAERAGLFAKDLAAKAKLFKKPPAWLMLPGAQFVLNVRCDAELPPAQVTEVEAALAFWLTFGGVGARTSRGLGRVTWIGDGFDAWERVIARAVTGKAPMTLTPLGFPKGHLPKPLMASQLDSPEKGVLWLLKAYKNFRQSREPSRPTPGRSHWHKAEAVRRAVPGYMYGPKRMPWPAPFTKDWMPEMLIGAPIVMTFAGRATPGATINDNGDPAGTFELVFAEPGAPGDEVLDRYASPITFGVRPVVINGSTVWQPHVLYLHALTDFTSRKLDVVVKQGRRELRRIPAGTWWTDFDLPPPNRECDGRARTAAFGSYPGPAGGVDVTRSLPKRPPKAGEKPAGSLIELFLRQVRDALSAP